MSKKRGRGRPKLPKQAKKVPFSMRLPPDLKRRLLLNSKQARVKAVSFAQYAIENECGRAEETRRNIIEVNTEF